ncbi:DNA alkylation repair protein [Azoarcus indigens]|uniref:3-methyladenine DNA glycosylase AlkD n=1 Tax=Azoarcus indigens TaxID=29545 RepID=A0A4R6EFT1_9RHOO|nr:DNA alkylation repair protein [Azoarcus indigens]NMG63597.1 DNA alkylation repair protein [Azoarcus indigens]TDN57149.1 3-methyladenine DNA glycosylase AlkD [Azoarcus indigens]
MHPYQAQLEAVQQALKGEADSMRAAAMRAYMRGRFPFLGVPTPLRRTATAAFCRQPLDAEVLLGMAEALWALPEREYQYVAVDLLGRQWKTLGPAHVEALLALASRGAWWDTVDSLAGVIGDLLRRARRRDGAEDVQRCMDCALQHEDPWRRRVAMIHQLGWRAETDSDRLFRYALALSGEPDFFIRKAIGWALRDYARHDPAAVLAFLQGEGGRLSPLSRREAGRHLRRS